MGFSFSVPSQREGVPHNHLKHSENGFRPLGEGRGWAFRRAGEGLPQAAVFVPAAAGLFLPPTAAFFTVDTAGVMYRMTVGMAPMPRRKTCFPTGIGDIPTKAKPPAVPTAFCVYFSPVWVEQIKAHSGMPTSSGNSVGVAMGRKAPHCPTSSQRTSGRRGADSLCCCANTADCGHRDAG